MRKSAALTLVIMFIVILSPCVGQEVAESSYLTDDGNLRHALVLRDSQGGFAGFSGHVWTIETDGSWRREPFLNKDVRAADGKGKFTKRHLAALAMHLTRHDLIGLPEQLGKNPGVNPHTFTITFGKKQSAMILTGGADVPKADPTKGGSAEQRFAGLVRLLKRGMKATTGKPDEVSKPMFSPLRLEINDSDDARAMLGRERGKPARPSPAIPLAVGQEVSLRFISKYANGRPAYRLAKVADARLEQAGEPVETTVQSGPYKGNKQQTYSFVARQSGDTKIELGFGQGTRMTTFTFRVHDRQDLEAIIARKQQGVRGLVIALTGNQQPRIGGGAAGKRTPISVPVYVFRNRVQPFEKPQPMHKDLVKIVESDKNGRFLVNLDPGIYTLVPVIDGKLQSQIMQIDTETGNKLWPSLRVLPGHHTPYTIEDTSGAVF